ncbi:MAG: M4 family metallopeptidase, partial [Acidothermales bacterium]|nr:M4 family metallopeptidase [Acidothermales bacterium]
MASPLGRRLQFLPVAPSSARRSTLEVTTVVLRRLPTLTAVVAAALAAVLAGPPSGFGDGQAAAGIISARPATRLAPPAVRVAGQADDRSALLRALQVGSDGPVRIRRDAAGRIRTVGTAPGEPLRPAGERAEPAAAARAFVGRYGPLFGVTDPARGLVQAGVESTDAGDVVRFTQRRNGLPVVAGELTVSVDDEGSVLSAAGETSTADAGGSLTVPSEQARETALQATAHGHRLRLDQLTAGEATAWAYDPSLIGAPGLPGSRPVWRVEVSSADSAVRELVLVDGSSGRVAFHINQVAAALDRVVCDARNQRGLPKTCTKGYVRAEGQGPSGLREADLAYDNVGRTANFFDRVLGVDLTRRIGSDTGDGRKLRSTVRWCDAGGECPMRNAFWNGEAMVFGDGFAGADDVVAHELTHGVTQSTGGLLYYYQSGAINESMSDVFGELVDLTDGFDLPGTQRRWRIGEDTPFGAIRDMRDPTRYEQPPRMRSLRYTGDRNFADNGGVHVNSGVGNKAAYLIADGGGYRGTTVRGLGLTKTAKIYW